MRSKSLVKDLMYEEPFGFRVVHHMLLTIFFTSYFFYNLTFKFMLINFKLQSQSHKNYYACN